MASRGLRVAVVGLGFGAEFVPIYQHHPDVAGVVLSDADPTRLKATGERYGIDERIATLDEALADRSVDAVHLLTPVPFHGAQAVKILEAGKHCASAVPMATSLTELANIIAAVRISGRTYMMMETAVYTRGFLMAQEMLKRGEFGTISFARGSHLQDMEGWQPSWVGFPPHHYMTHAISPLLKLLNARVEKVHCLGSGRLPEERQKQYGNPYPVETAIFRLHRQDAAVEVTRSLFQTVRPFTESFAIYGDKLGFEWPQVEDEDPILFTVAPAAPGERRKISHRRVAPPDRQDLLPPQIAPFTQRHKDPANPGGFVGGGHGGSHPHLVHEFVSSIVQGRKPAIDEIVAATWTAPGIAAHQSAMAGGEAVFVPDFA
jgi:predicted dehydrogenase